MEMNENVIPLQRNSSAVSRAQEWIVRIDAGRLTPHDRYELQAWLAEDPSHAKVLDTHALLWSEAARAAFPAVASREATSLGSNKVSFAKAFGVPARAGWPRPGTWLAGAAFALTLAAVFWGAPLRTFMGPLDGPPVAASTMATNVGQQIEVPLVDGSQVHLNTSSTIRVAYSKERRRVVLDKGEGLFDVAKDPMRPFEVVAGNTTVRAIGTKFSVVLLPDGRTDVTVFEGVVEVLRTPIGASESMGNEFDAAHQMLRLAAGQTVTTQADRVVLQKLAKPALENKLAWRDDRIVFDSVSLGEAVTQVNRYSPIPLHISDPALMDLHVSGAFSTADVPVFVRSLEHGFGLHVERTSEAYLISKAVSR
jgi:transmembrane sensor